MPLPSSTASNFFAQYYYTKTELNAGQLNTIYFTESEFIATSAGAGDAGKPVKLDSGGHIDASMINDADVDHGTIGGLSDDDHTGYALLAGRSGGQTLYGDTAANGDITVRGTSNATKTTSYVILQDTGGFVGINTAAPTYPLDIVATTAGFHGLRVRNASSDSAAYTLMSIEASGASGALQAYPSTFSNATYADRIILAANSDASGLVLNAPSASQTIRMYAGNSTLRAEVTSAGLDVTGTITATAVTVGGNAVLTTGSSISHTSLDDIGSNSHATIDTLLGDANTHYSETTGIHGVGAGAIVGTTNPQTLTNKKLTSAILDTAVYGSEAANGDITIYGTNHATKTTSYVLLNPTSGGVGVGTSDPGTGNFTVGDSGGDKLFIFDPDGGTGSTPKLTAYTVGGATTTALEIASSTLTLNPGTKGLIFSAQTTPSSASDTGSAGAFCWDSSYLYIATGTDTWRRVAHATW